MTTNQLELARRFCDAVGWNVATTGNGTVCLHYPCKEYPGHCVQQSIDWLYTGDGMLAVTAEMTKRGFSIETFTHDACTSCLIRKLPQETQCATAPTEPEARLLAAVAAMER